MNRQRKLDQPRIRLMGVDCPEFYHGDLPLTEPLAWEARFEAMRFLGIDPLGTGPDAARVRIQISHRVVEPASGRLYGSVARILGSSCEDLGAHLVRMGLATVWRKYPCDDPDDPLDEDTTGELWEAQLEALASGRHTSIWSIFEDAARTKQMENLALLQMIRRAYGNMWEDLGTPDQDWDEGRESLQRLLEEYERRASSEPAQIPRVSRECGNARVHTDRGQPIYEVIENWRASRAERDQ